MPRQARLDAAGTLHHVIIRGIEKRRIDGMAISSRIATSPLSGERYFTELVRYLHLNPLRVKLVADLKELEKYPYCGHGVILETVKNEIARPGQRPCAIR